jgi:hypothetical protein
MGKGRGAGRDGYLGLADLERERAVLPADGPSAPFAMLRECFARQHGADDQGWSAERADEVSGLGVRYHPDEWMRLVKYTSSMNKQIW